jgi:hypothetical protein
MNTNLDKIAQDLYKVIDAKFSDIQFGDQHGEVLSKKTDIPKARFFEFEYKDQGVPLGTVALTLDDDDGLLVELTGDLAKKNHPDVFNLIRGFRQFAKNRLLNFHVDKVGKSNLDKRDYEFKAKPKEEPAMEPMMESKLYGTNKISYQDLGEARLVIRHSQPVNTELAAGRTMHIDSIYVENSQGERFRYPFKHLNGARALAEHIKAGGNPYDPIGKHITSLSEELAQLRKFKSYVGRNNALSEAMGDITNKVMERIEEVKKEVSMLQRTAYYQQFAESFEDQEEQMIPEEIMSDWIDRLTIRTFNEDLKTAFPYIFRLVDESEIPVKEINPDDLLDETDVEEAYNPNSAGAEHARNVKASFRKDMEAKAKSGDEKAKSWLKHDDQKTQRMKNDYDARMERESVDHLDSFLDSLLSEDLAQQNGINTLLSPDPQVRNAAINNLKRELGNGLKIEGDGSNVIDSLKGIIDGNEFAEKLKDAGDGADVATVIKIFVSEIANGSIQIDSEGAQETAQELSAKDGPLDQLISGEDSAEPVGGEEAPDMSAEAPPAPAPDMSAPPPDMSAEAPPAPAPDMSAPPPDMSGMPPAPGTPPAPMAESGTMSRLKAKLIKVFEAGADLDTELDFGYKVVTLGEAMRECGISIGDRGEHEENIGVNPVKQMLATVEGFWDAKTEQYNCGATKAKIKILKAYKNGDFEGATPEHVKEAFEEIERRDPSSSTHELKHISHLAGVQQHTQAPVQETQKTEVQETSIDAMKKLLSKISKGN